MKEMSQGIRSVLTWCRRHALKLGLTVGGLALVLAVVLPLVLTFTGIFRQGRVENINFGDTKEQVLEELGEPYDMSDYEWVYYSKSYTKIQKKIDKLKAEQNGDLLETEVDEWEDIENAFDESLAADSKLEKLKEKLKAATYDMITVRFNSEGSVESVVLELDHCDAQTHLTDRVIEDIHFCPESIGGYTDTERSVYRAKVYYENGDYRMEQVSLTNAEEIDTSKSGSVVARWENAWGECAVTVRIDSALHSGDVITGEIGEHISYELSVMENGSLANLPPMQLTLRGTGAVDGATAQAALGRFMTAIREITFADGIATIEGDLFTGMTALQTVTLNSTGVDCTVVAGNEMLMQQCKQFYCAEGGTAEAHVSGDAAGIIIAPTCATEGHTIYTCTICKTAYRDDYVPASGKHICAAGAVTAPTCTEPGYTAYACTTCEHSYQSNYVPAHGHTASGEGAITAPTCTKQGYTTYTCTVCKEAYQDQPVSASGTHTYGTGVVTAPTCTAQGYTAYTCTACEHSRYDSYVPATGHNFGDAGTVTAPTCTEQGYTTYFCEDCTYSYRGSYVGALGHSLHETSVVTAPTCTGQGYTTHTCVRCGANEQSDYVAASGHHFVGAGSVTPPTCVAEGYTTHTCTVCLGNYRDSFVAATGEHQYNRGVVTAPTCVARGYTTHTCQVCGHSYQDSFVEARHTYDAGIVTAPTCTEQGYTTYICTVCGHSYQDDLVAALGHNFGSNKTCIVCGYKPYTRVDANGNKSDTGDYILFGSYPQTEMTDSSLTSTLTSMAGATPTSSNANAWTSYGYYINGSVSNYMWYQDIVYNGETYRGVYFTSYRPFRTDSEGSTGNTHQYANGYYTSNIYWFKFEPILWRIVAEANGEVTLVCEMLIDSQEFNNHNSYINNYAKSNIRAWLNDSFYETAFNELERDLILLTTVDSYSWAGDFNQYVRENIEDYIYLLSCKEATTYFASDSARVKQTTDYAQCQGAYTYRGGSYDGNGDWWLRSPNANITTIFVDYVDYDGGAGNSGANGTSLGVCPALRICL